MKKVFLSSIFIVGVLGLYGQNLTLTFTALDSTAYVRLDSVMIINRSQGGTTTIYWPDTTVSMEITPGDLLLLIGYSTLYPVGVQQFEQDRRQFQLFQNYPNPVMDQSFFSLCIPEKGMVNIMVTDIQGRIILTSDWQLDQGNHSFRFIPGEGNIFFLTASWEGISRSIKILTTEQHRGQRCMLHYEASTGGEPGLKASPQAGSFISMESGILDAPETDKTYIFQFAMNIPCPGTPAIVYEGQVYNTLQVFSQCWLRENLNAGTMISGTIEQLNNRTIEKYCYNNDPVNCSTYGGLYQWNETMQYTTVQLAKGICPPGWHMPMDEEWKVLEGAVDGQYGFADPEWDTEGYRGHDAGGSLKETGTTHWNAPNVGATNSTGFTGLPGGNVDYGTGNFTAMGAGGSFWSSSQNDDQVAWYRALNYASPHAYRKYVDKSSGYSVRCLKGCAPVQAYAGENGTTCESMVFDLAGTTAANYASLLWTTSGTGTFDDATLLHPMYTPSQEDLLMAEVMLTLNASGGGECPDATSAMTLMITGAPAANAGEDTDICSTQGSFTLSGTAADYSSVLWTTSGTGTFNDPSLLTATYSPSPGDKVTGQLTLTLTVNGNGPCDPIDDAMTLKIWTGKAYAGPDQPDVPGTSTTLEGNTPTFGNGLWQIVSGTGGTIDNPVNPSSGFHGVIYEEYSLTWTISNIVCEPSVDTVVIRFTFPCGDDLDYAGQSYATVLIGDQCWMAENLNVGTLILDTQDMTNNDILEKWCYDNNEFMCDIYGGLYMWNEAMTYVIVEGIQGICPTGWHFPSDEDWASLEYYLGGLGAAGGKMKSTGTIEQGTGLWYEPNTGATNESGFTGNPGGCLYPSGSNFLYLGNTGHFWSSSYYNGTYSWGRELNYDDAEVGRADYHIDFGFSVRCIKND